MKTIYMQLSNYYGSVIAKSDGEKHWIELDDYSGTDKTEISKELFEAIEKEFE